MAKKRTYKIKKAHYCPECGEKMKEFTDNEGVGMQCPHVDCGQWYMVYFKSKPAMPEKPLVQLKFDFADYTDIPF